MSEIHYSNVILHYRLPENIQILVDIGFSIISFNCYCNNINPLYILLSVDFQSENIDSEKCIVCIMNKLFKNSDKYKISIIIKNLIDIFKFMNSVNHQSFIQDGLQYLIDDYTDIVNNSIEEYNEVFI